MKKRAPFYAYLWVADDPKRGIVGFEWNGAFRLEQLEYVLDQMRRKRCNGFYREIATKRNIPFDFRESL